ncbi:MAG: hypothetical protein AAF791_06400 [Bacteroidota bacterium]
MSARLGPIIGGIVGALVFLAGCAPSGSSPPPPTMSPGFPSGGPVEVREGATPEFTWERPGARRVEVREGRRGDVVWQIDAAETPNGRRSIEPPLTYGASALPPGVNPPDGPDYHVTFGPVDLVPGDTYSVVVRWEGERRASATFTAR